MEIHSAWGTFEWLLTDGFSLGHRCGVVCNSDGHKSRPGASHPGAASFGSYGGLTCFLAPKLTREALFDCLRRRRHYGTSGCRLHFERAGADRVEWDVITTGNFGGFDVWLEESADATLVLETNRISGEFPLCDIGLEDTVLEAGGLERRVRIFRLPEENTVRQMQETISVNLTDEGDNPLWVRVTTEDGFNAWSSPIFLYRKGSLLSE